MLSMQSLAKRPNRRRVEKRQTDNVCLTTVYRNGMRGAKCEGAQITDTQKVQDTEQVTKKDAERLMHNKKRGAQRTGPTEAQ